LRISPASPVPSLRPHWGCMKLPSSFLRFTLGQPSRQAPHEDSRTPGRELPAALPRDSGSCTSVPGSRGCGTQVPSKLALSPAAAIRRNRAYGMRGRPCGES
jgi:hypothetical protein